jgi:hypothetical protein
VLAFKLARLMMAIVTPEATISEAAMQVVGWLITREPP